MTVLPPLVADAELALELDELELELDDAPLDPVFVLPDDAPAPAPAPAPAEAETPPTLAEAELEELELAELEELEELELLLANITAGLVASTVVTTKMKIIIYFIFSYYLTLSK